MRLSWSKNLASYGFGESYGKDLWKSCLFSSLISIIWRFDYVTRITAWLMKNRQHYCVISVWLIKKNNSESQFEAVLYWPSDDTFRIICTLRHFSDFQCANWTVMKRLHKIIKFSYFQGFSDFSFDRRIL